VNLHFWTRGCLLVCWFGGLLLFSLLELRFGCVVLPGFGPGCVRGMGEVDLAVFSWGGSGCYLRLFF
jgi:hypothetical protein